MNLVFQAVFGGSVGCIWERSDVMRAFKKLSFLLIACCIASFFVGCENRCDHCDESYHPKYSYFLVNAIDRNLYYLSYDIDTLFEAILLSGDTLFLYSKQPMPPGAMIIDSACFFWLLPEYGRDGTIMIKDERGFLIYYSGVQSCGQLNFVGKSPAKSGAVRFSI
jgi:hypothetical protein